MLSKKMSLALFVMTFFQMGCPGPSGMNPGDFLINYTFQDGAPGLSATSYAVGVDTVGLVRVAGIVSGCPRESTMFGGVSVSSCLNHLFVSRFKAAGTLEVTSLLSQTDLGFSGVDSVTFDSAGNSYWVSSVTRLLQFRDGLSPVTEGYRVIKVDASGTVVWSVVESLPSVSGVPEVSYVDGSREIVRNAAVSVDSSGNVYVTGRAFLGGFFVVKHDSAGAEVWRFIEKTPTPGRDNIDVTTADVAFVRGAVPSVGTYFVIGSQGADVAVDSVGRVYVVGRARVVTLGDDKNFGSASASFLARLNSSGVLESISVDYPAPSEILPQNGGLAWASRVVFDATSDSVLVAGESRPYDSSVVSYFLSKYSLIGQHQWSTTDHATGGVEVRALAVGSDGTAYLGCLASGPFIGEKSSVLGSVAVLRFNADGSRQWTKREEALDSRTHKAIENSFWFFDSLGPTSVTGLAVDESQHVYITGATHGSLDGETQRALNDGSTDYYLQQIPSM